ncbi:hypothetical protein JCM10908_004250 [Rhodotorula pacifica]|uniref:uncharacterized protein n=1 Tax=Rhodotorula pacifica TaxID=1495444 RepID=UPI003181DFBC
MAAYPEVRSTSGSPGGLGRRTRELQQEGALLSSTLTPSQVQLDATPLPLSTVHEHSIPAQIGSAALISPGRPRAGTLPSTFHLKSSPPTSASAGFRSPFGAPDALLLPPSNRMAPISLPNSGQSTPLEQPFASALLPPSTASTGSNGTHSRLRSGSLTLPSSNLSNVFGAGVFSSEAWERTPNEPVGGSAEAVRRNLRANGPKVPVRESSYSDDSHVRTLDYLGLADEVSSGSNPGGDRLLPSGGGGGGGVGDGLSAPAAPLMQRLGSAGSVQSSPSSLGDYAAQHNRLRSNTVGTFSRTSPSADSLLRPYISPSYPSSATGGSPLLHPTQPSDGLYPLSAPNGAVSASSTSTSGSYHSQHRPSASIDSARLLYATTGTSSAPSTSPAPSGGSGQLLQHSASTTTPLVSLVPPPASDSASPSSGGAATLASTSLDTLPPHQRGRSATIAIVDDPAKAEMHHRRRAGTTVGIPPHQLGIGAQQGGSSSSSSGGQGAGPGAGVGGVGVGPVQAMASRMGRLSISEDSTQPGGIGWAGAGGSSEGVVSLSPPPQQPTRSLWVGNLDPKTSPAELQDVFAPYGAIESLRLIPEKECGFVNFVSVADAMRAKEDVLNRLGGQLTKTSGLVRIGYGKAESTPSPNAPGLVHPRSASGQPTPADLNLQTQPTRALWVGSIPATTTPNHLLAVFSAFGPIESARVLTHKSCGFVNFERLDDAVSARKALNGREILGNQVGPVRIGFAKVPTKVATAPFGNGESAQVPAQNGIGSYPHVYDALSHISGVTGVPVEKQLADGQVQDYRSNMLVGLVADEYYATAHMFANGHGPAPVETTSGSLNEMQLLMRELSQGEDELEEHVEAVAADRPPKMYYTSIPLAVLNDPRFARRYSQHDAPRLREIRKRLEGEINEEEADSIAHDLMDEVVPLASDYIGNTLVQKLFELTSVPVRKAMLERIAPHLAPIGTHKNGTWAVQKIIQCAEDEDEFALIEQSLAPYTPPLLLNDFGNYVVQGALRFAPPHSDFIFDAMVDRIWEIGAGRFGARSTRQTLESPEAPRLQVKRVASAIILNAIPLATSSNGALLVTWLLESSGLPNRFSLVAPRFAPHLSHLCTHKLASQSIMRVINQTEDDKAQQIMIDAFVDRETKVLEDVLVDQMHGIPCIQKVISSTFLTEERQQALYARCKEVIETLGLDGTPAYRRLIEDIGGVYTGPLSGLTPPYTPAGVSSNGGRSSGRAGNRGPSPSLSPPFPRRPQNLHHQGVGNGHQHFVPPQLSYPPASPYMNQMAYPPPPPPAFGAPTGYPMYPHPMYGGQPGSSMMPFSPSLAPTYGPGSPHGSHGQGPSTPAASPHVSHASMPYSPGAYPPIASPDPFQALRVSAGDGSAAFNPAFSPLASPPPPFFTASSFSTFAAQQDAARGAADGAF